MPKVKIDGVNLYYEIHGGGFPLLMIQGLSENVYWWDPPMIEMLSKHFKTVLFDNRGVGRSDSLEGDVTIEMMATDAVGLLDALDIKQTHILGHSMGGMITQELALKFPERIEKLILYSTSCGGSKAELPSRDTQRILTKLSAREHTRDLIEEAMSHIFAQKFIEEDPEFIAKKIADILIIPTGPTTFKAQMTAWMRYNSCRKLKTINLPTLIMHGKQDILVPPRNSELLAEKMSTAETIWFDTSAHMIHMEELDNFINELLKFLR